eukprot:GHVU01192932.1.p1 GENE.GHVU01192932.1~~GHVU01192932.1.p1  ORF type:complete len:155 (+),score=31.69 GHVU01192932.1:551-1015(+)
MTIAHKAAYFCHNDIIKMAADAGSTLDTANMLGRTPLHYACLANNSEGVSLLLQSDARPEARTLAGHTPLHLASRAGATDAMEALLSAERLRVMELEAEDKAGRSPLEMANNERTAEVIRGYILKQREILQTRRQSSSTSSESSRAASSSAAAL